MSLTLENSHICYTPWSVFQDGSYEAIFTRSLKAPQASYQLSQRAFPKEDYSMSYF